MGLFSFKESILTIKQSNVHGQSGSFSNACIILFHFQTIRKMTPSLRGGGGQHLEGVHAVDAHSRVLDFFVELAHLARVRRDHRDLRSGHVPSLQHREHHLRHHRRLLRVVLAPAASSQSTSPAAQYVGWQAGCDSKERVR